MPLYVYCFASVIISLAVSLYAVKKIIFITRKRKIFDIPDNVRKIHGEQIPSLGGVGIFIGFMSTIPFFIPYNIGGWNYVIISTVILFFTGIYDDIMNMRPSKKLLAQLLASGITVYFANLSLEMAQVFGIDGLLAIYINLVFTTVCCTFFINVFNFIDGIDGLACMSAMLYGGIAAILFWITGYESSACISLALVGACAGLLYFNYAPAKVYMGDTGSMLVGFVVFVLFVMFIRQVPSEAPEWLSTEHSRVVLVCAVLFMPVFDALRVFVLRMRKGISPLKADRRHLHYYLLDAGQSHASAAWLLILVNAVSATIAAVFIYLPYYILLPIIAIPAVLLSAIAARVRKES